MAIENLTDDDLKKLARLIADFIDPLRDEVKDLKRALEQRSYKGLYEHGVEYRQHNSVTHAGSFWIARKDTMSMPGTDDSWVLAVRRGKDGKDLRAHS